MFRPSPAGVASLKNVANFFLEHGADLHDPARIEGCIGFVYSVLKVVLGCLEDTQVILTVDRRGDMLGHFLLALVAWQIVSFFRSYRANDSWTYIGR